MRDEKWKCPKCDNDEFETDIFQAQVVRGFTGAEKEQLQAKIKDERERQRVLREIAQIESEKELKRMRGVISTALSFKYGFLVLIICLLVWEVAALLKWRHSDYDQYPGLMIVLSLLFNHVAFHFTKRGWSSRVMKTIALIWIVFAFIYVFWIF